MSNISKYVEFYYEGLSAKSISYSDVADRILEDLPEIGKSHRTLRRLISEEFKEYPNTALREAAKKYKVKYNVDLDQDKWMDLSDNVEDTKTHKVSTIDEAFDTIRKSLTDYMDASQEIQGEEYDSNPFNWKMSAPDDQGGYVEQGVGWIPYEDAPYIVRGDCTVEEEWKPYQNGWEIKTSNADSTTHTFRARRTGRIPELEPYLDGDVDNVLVIFDPHEPFCKKGYMEHCHQVQVRFNCGRVVFSGDVIDSHYSSFHPSDPDGYSAGEELDRAIAKIAEWHRLFPNAKVCLGNHDLIILRKAFASGLSKKWIKDLHEVLEAPTWEFGMEFDIDNVLYTHTLGSNTIGAAVNRRQSVVTGHLHTKADIVWNVSKVDRLFAMSGGCGIDDNSYAFAYAKLNAKKSILTTGVVLDKGKLPILVPMEL